MLDHQILIGKIFGTLNANATLQGAKYLTGTGRIWSSPDRPNQLDNPLMTVRGNRLIQESQVERWRLVISAFVGDYENGTVNLTRLGKIIAEVKNTLHDNHSLTIADGEIKQIFVDTETDVLFDNRFPKEHSQSLLFTLFASKNT